MSWMEHGRWGRMKTGPWTFMRPIAAPCGEWPGVGRFRAAGIASGAEILFLIITKVLPVVAKLPIAVSCKRGVEFRSASCRANRR